jgi:hypothetical protein
MQLPPLFRVKRVLISMLASSQDMALVVLDLVHVQLWLDFPQIRKLTVCMLSLQEHILYMLQVHPSFREQRQGMLLISL